MEKLAYTAFWIVASGISGAQGVNILVEAEGFADRGGWVIDQQSMDQMGSPYLLAHGLGVPVADAATTVSVPSAGAYRVLVRTRDWVATWKAPGAPGRFQLAVNGRALDTLFGTEGAEWHWQEGGKIELPAGPVKLALHDLTGFNGRCDAVLLTTDDGGVPPNEGVALDTFRRQMSGLPGVPEDGGEYDLVVVGGGMAGCCAAVGAADEGPVTKADLTAFLKAYPAVAKIVKDEAARLTAWAKKGEFAELAKNERADLARMRAGNMNEQVQKEIADEEKNLAPLELLEAQEKRLAAMDAARLERYAFVNVFVVLRGFYHDKSFTEPFMRCLYEGAEMAKDYKDVYWCIYKKDFEDYIRWWIKEFKLEYRDFTVICDDDAKLDRLILTLELYARQSIPSDLR